MCRHFGCDRPARTRGYCKAHYEHRRRTGSIPKVYKTRQDPAPVALKRYRERPIVSDTSWQQRGACRGKSTSIFFPERGGPVEIAKRICAGCPVRQECLAYAFEFGITHGVYGGMSERQRRRMRVESRRQGVAS